MFKKIMTGLCLSVMVVIGACAYAQSQEGNQDWYGQRGLNDPDRPYLYYPDANDPKQPKGLPQTPQEAQAALEELQESVKLSRALAIMNPTAETLKDYITKQEVVMSKSAMFTDVWRRTIWSNPELDYSLKHRPTDATAIRAYDANKDAQKNEIMANIAATQGLVFFMRGDCSYCHAFAPILKQFQKAYGLNVMTITLDGGSIEGFDAIPDNGIAAKLGVTVTPTLFLADTRNKRYLPIGSGVMSATELENRFITQLSQPGEAF